MGTFYNPKHFRVMLICFCNRWLYSSHMVILTQVQIRCEYVILNFHSMVQNQFGVEIKKFWSNNARDYFNQVLSLYLQKGVIHESSCVSTSQQNWVAERKKGHLLNSSQALLFHINVSKTYWWDSVLTITYMINRLPLRVLDSKTPIKLLTQFYPHVRTSNGLPLKIYGVYFIHEHSQNGGKLDPRAIKCVFIGYSSTQNGYRCYNPLSKKLYIATNVTFAETKQYFSMSYLQGETSSVEVKEFGFLDISLTYKRSIQRFVQSFPIHEPIQEST